MKIGATLVKGKDLKPGDLFSMLGPVHWDRAMDMGSIGELVYIRTNIDASRAPDPEQEVYLLRLDPIL